LIDNKITCSAVLYDLVLEHFPGKAAEFLYLAAKLVEEKIPIRQFFTVCEELGILGH